MLPCSTFNFPVVTYQNSISDLFFLSLFIINSLHFCDIQRRSCQKCLKPYYKNTFIQVGQEISSYQKSISLHFFSIPWNICFKLLENRKVTEDVWLFPWHCVHNPSTTSLDLTGIYLEINAILRGKKGIKFTYQMSHRLIVS